MSDVNQVLTTIDDYLLSLADGIALAQTQLSRLGAQGPPGKQFNYYLPKLDFELRMTLNMVESSSLSERYDPYRGERAARDQHVCFAPVTSEQQASSSFSAEIVSVIKGSFVAVPANEGLPAVHVSSQLDASNPQAVVVTVRARNAAGEPMAGLEVQFNLDRDETVTLTDETGTVDGSTLNWTGTYLRDGVVTTDSSGQATTTLFVGGGMAKGARLAVVLDAAYRTELLVYEVR
ncbi:MAG: hypothetical protein H6739_14330 [Alphaproteobacteria bacterium]|nr:hypothetical protein [Alphaproteobacteria bacterium]